MIRKTKIVATIGPAVHSAKKVEALIHSGVDVFRINTSHSGVDGLRDYARLIRSVSERIGKPVSILVDLQGPRIRTGRLAGGRPIRLKSGGNLSILMGKGLGNVKHIYTPFDGFYRLVKKGELILIDNGSLKLKVIRSSRRQVDCKIEVGGILGENKGINLPSAPLNLPALNARDQKIVKVACELDAAFIALSFVRGKQDLLTLRKYIQKSGKRVAIIPKLEKPVALEHLDEILSVSDGVMVARGDLGIEMGVEKVPAAQKLIVEKAGALGIPVIIATQMLESMMQNPSPTRAEASDVANAVFDGADAVMLSGETANGRYPNQSVRFMAKIINEAESHCREKEFLIARDVRETQVMKPIEAVTHAAYDAANRIQADAIVVFTLTGRTAAAIARFRPKQPIFALTPHWLTYQKMRLNWGIVPVETTYIRSTDALFAHAEKILVKRKLLKPGATVVSVLGRNTGMELRDLIRIHRLMK